MGSIEPVYLRTAVLATLAVIVSYSVGNATAFIAADIAAIWALVTVRATFHAAVKESVVQIAGSIIGGLVGYFAIAAYGFSLGLLGVLVLFSFAAGMLLRLGLEGSVIMGFTIIAVMSNSFSLESTEARVAGVVLGTLVAMTLSIFVTSGTPQRRVRQEMDALRARKQNILTQVTDAMSAGPIPAELMFKLKIEAKIVEEEVEGLEDRARELVQASRWSPLTREDEAQFLLEEVKGLQDDAATVIDMLDSLETLGAALPATVAEYAKWSIARASQQLDEEQGEPGEISYVDMPQYAITELTPTQVIYTGDLIAGAEKIRRRRSNRVVAAPTPNKVDLRSAARKLKPSKRTHS